MDDMAWRNGLSEAMTGAISAIIVYVLSFKKNKKELQKNELELVKEAINIWQDTAEELRNQMKQLLIDIATIQRENRRLNVTVNRLTKALHRFDPDLASEISNELKNTE